MKTLDSTGLYDSLYSTSALIGGFILNMNIEQSKKRLAKLKAITKYSDRTGWMIDEVAFFLYSLVKLYKPSLVIQIGHLWGKSALFLLQALTDGFLMDGERIEDEILSGDKKFFSYIKSQWPKVRVGKLISVDAYPYGNWKKGIAYLKKTYGDKRFDFKVLKSEDFFNTYAQELSKKYSGKTILGVVDGDHSYQACLNDLKGMASLNADYIFVDDLKWIPHIKKACEVFIKKYPYIFSFFPSYNGIAVLSKK